MNAKDLYAALNKRFAEGGEVIDPNEEMASGFAGGREPGKAEEAFRALVEGSQGFLGLEPGRRGSEAYRTGQALSNLPALALPAAAVKGTGKASQMLEEIAKKAGIDNLITAEKSLLNLDDSYVSLQDAVRMRVAEQQRLVNSMPFKYEPGQMVYTADTVKRNMPPLEIVGKRIETRIVKDPNDSMKTIKDPATGRALRHPPEQSYFVTQRFPNGDISSFTISESAILGPLDKKAHGGEVSTTDFIRKRQAGSPPEGEVDIVEQMTVGTLPEDRGPGTAEAALKSFVQAVKNPRETAAKVGQSVLDSAARAQALQERTFGDPNRPFKVTDPQALREYTDMMMAGPLGFAPAGVTAYHGSGNLFRRFDPSKRGTGEGAQQYGVGAGYTAEARPVGEGYRMQIASREGKEATIGGKSLGSVFNEVYDKANKLPPDLAKSEYDKASLIEMMMLDKSPAEILSYAKDIGYPKNVIKWFETEIVPKTNIPGYLYKGDIPDEIIPTFLDWDKPLSQQTEVVRKLLGKDPLVKESGSPKSWKDVSGGIIQKKDEGPAEALSGGELYKYISLKLGSDQAASDYLDKLGLRGIRYLDQGSRVEGKGTSNYVPFRSEDYKVEEINDLPLEEWIKKGLIKERSRGSPPEGEVTNDEYIQQMMTGTPPMDRQRNPGILPPELRQAVDVPLDFLNLLVRGGAGAVAGPAYGLYKGVTGGKYGTPEGVKEASSEAGKMMQKITGEPKTQTARDTLEFIGKKAEEYKAAPLPQLLTLPVPGPGAASALMRNYQLAKTPPGGAINVPGTKATRIFEEIPTTKTTATQYGAEFVQSPFVGRLDKMIAELPGPVQKEQFLNQLKGKFRDYEIGRAKEALKDLPDNAKVTPFDLLNKIKEDFDPSRYGTSIVKPDPNNPDRFYATSMDNIYKAPLGVIHLRQLATPEAEAGIGRAKDMYQALKNTTHAGINSDSLSTPDSFNNYKVNVNEFLRDLNQPERSVEANRLLDTAQSSINLYGRLSDAVDTINYPTLSSVYKTLQAEQKALSKRFDYNEAVRTATQSAINDLDDLFPGTKVKLYDDIQALSGSDLTLRTKAASNIRDAFSPIQNTVRETFRQSMSGLRELLEKTYNNPKSPMAQFGYQGQHSGLGRTPTQSGIPNEIAFSRYSEHTTDVPDLGKVDGIYVHELQSDRLDDIRKKGPLGGSPSKDLPKAAELGKKLQNLTEQAAIENQRYLDNPTTEQKQKLTELQEQQKRTQEQLNKWMKRISEGDYKIKESFVGMEESPQVIQQLMAKNVIAAAIQMGKNFVAFPGAESSQAQLYEKLPNNLKQVVKDLGPGFEYRPITLKTPDGQDVMHPGVVWDKYGAGRIGAEGIPFKKGGEVRTEDFIKKVLK